MSRSELVEPAPAIGVNALESVTVLLAWLGSVIDPRVARTRRRCPPVFNRGGRQPFVFGRVDRLPLNVESNSVDLSCRSPAKVHTGLVYDRFEIYQGN